MKRNIILPIIAVFLAITVLAGGTYAYAETQSGEYPSIVKKLAEKFGLKESDVWEVFDQDRTERQSQMQEKFEERLTQAVKDGKITEAQKKLILDKHKELQANKQTMSEIMRDKTPEERKTTMNAQRQEFEDWAEKNGIDSQYLFGLGGFKGKFGGARGGWHMR